MTGTITHSYSFSGFLASTDIVLVADHGHSEVVKVIFSIFSLIQILNLDSVLCIDQEVDGVEGINYNVGALVRTIMKLRYLQVSDTSIFTRSHPHAEAIFTNLSKVIARRRLGIKLYMKSVIIFGFRTSLITIYAGNALLVAL